MRTVAVIQARLGSARLPMKSLLCLRGSPIVDWVVDRTRTARLVDMVVVACPDTPLDRVLAQHLQSRGVPVVTGPEDDVLARYVIAARKFEAARVVRVCADNPLIWGEAVDRLVRFHEASHAEYSYNHIPRDCLWPDGLGAEIVDRRLLERMAVEAHAPSQREHCLNWIWDNPDRCTPATFDPEEEWLRRPDIKLDIDTAEDFRRLALLPVTRESDAREIIEAADSADFQGRPDKPGTARR
ncbi:MAG: NTP transferase domain-containing protein [Desulfovibrionaceae bacterium]|nr:NTP transferase domain-containing protein [Desulfovibrionaceae bacterium]